MSEAETEIQSVEPSETNAIETAQEATAQKPEAKVLHRVRVVYARQEALRYVSNLDMQTVWERMLRRAEVPLAYSQGFNARPRLHFASALPLGFLSICEIADFWVEQAPGEPVQEETELAESLAKQMRATAPPGLDIQTVEIVPLTLPALQTLVQAAEFGVVPLDPLDTDALVSAVEQILQAESLPRERRGKPYDLRPLIEALEVRAQDSRKPEIFMRLTAREGATGRPEEVLGALDLDAAAFRIERKALILAE